jgi:hypothetical protein
MVVRTRRAWLLARIGVRISHTGASRLGSSSGRQSSGRRRRLWFSMRVQPLITSQHGAQPRDRHGALLDEITTFATTAPSRTARDMCRDLQSRPGLSGGLFPDAKREPWRRHQPVGVKLTRADISARRSETALGVAFLGAALHGDLQIAGRTQNSSEIASGAGGARTHDRRMNSPALTRQSLTMVRRLEEGRAGAETLALHACQPRFLGLDPRSKHG